MQISELTKSTMQYPLHEKIGDPDLFVGRKEEFESFHEWIEKMPRLMAQSRVLLARRKSGKTALVQRLFNQLWSANGRVIPFYFSIPETAIWYPAFALMYYRTFATQYISFLERDSELMQYPLEMAEIRAYGEANSISCGTQPIAHPIAWPLSKNEISWSSSTNFNIYPTRFTRAKTSLVIH